MTSSHEIIQKVVDDTISEIELMTSTSLVDAEKLKLMIFYAAQFPYSNDHEKMLPKLISRSTTSRVVFRRLLLYASEFVDKELPLPDDLRNWLVSVLKHQIEEPSRGKKGPNKSIYEDVILLTISNKIKDRTTLPIWNRDTMDGMQVCALGLITMASQQIKSRHGKSPYPVKLASMEKRYIEARKKVLGESNFKILKINKNTQED